MTRLRSSAILFVLACGLVGCGARATPAPADTPAPKRRDAQRAQMMPPLRPVEALKMRAPTAIATATAAPPTAAAMPAAEPEGLRSHIEEEDFDGDGIADSRTIRRFRYDAFGRPCLLVTERDFDADGTIDARTTDISAYGGTADCGN